MAVPSVSVPSLNVTIPKGVPAPGAVAWTVAVSVTGWPKLDGLPDDASAVVVAAGFTVWVSAADWLPKDLPDQIYPYLKNHPTGRQLALIMSLPDKAPVLYLDSDILFFAGAGDLHAHMERRDVPALYLADCRFSGDERLLNNPAEANDPVNTGFLLLFQKLDWSVSVQRFLELKGDPTFFTNA